MGNNHKNVTGLDIAEAWRYIAAIMRSFQLQQRSYYLYGVMLSKRAKYAIRALLYLHNNSGTVPISAKVISVNEKIPYKFLENILRELRQHRILTSERGADGGYRLLKDPGTVTVSEVIRIVDGPIALIPCVSENFYEKCAECLDEETCKIRRLFGDVRQAMLPLLEQSITQLNTY